MNSSSWNILKTCRIKLKGKFDDIMINKILEWGKFFYITCVSKQIKYFSKSFDNFDKFYNDINIIIKIEIINISFNLNSILFKNFI